MFETEIKEIRNKLAKTLRLWRKVEKLEKEISNTKDVFYMYIRNDGKHSLYQQATNGIVGLLKGRIGDKFASGWVRNKKEFDALCFKKQQITKKDVLEALKESVNCEYNKRNGLAPETNKDTITIGLSGYSLPLLLSSLNILINNDIEKSEIIDKARQALKDCNTFVYRGIKITIYKNGKTKLVFLNDKIKNIFVDKIIQV